MKKKIVSMLLALAAVMSFGAAMADDAVTVIVNDKKLEFEEVAPFIENEHTLVPFRAIFEAIGAEVSWDGETKTVISYDPATDTSVVLQIDSDIMFVNETPVTLETPAKIVNDGFTVVPVRAVSEGLKREVDWDNETRNVTVKTKEE